MLCPNLATQGQLVNALTNPTKQGQFIGESEEGLAFAIQDCGGEYKNIGANAKPLQVFGYKSI